MAVFDEGTTFRAIADFPSTTGDRGFFEVEFSIRNTTTGENPAPKVSQLEIAQAISALAQSKGYGPVVFRGSQASAQLHP
ncbi:hypothetical protein [Streptomyces sp. NPDC020965]|uniref:hypothetical protein n=1 Tax=Streptomyces sp. NPDC020965 TaxID=3365105 RepID=UPI0037B591EA